MTQKFHPQQFSQDKQFHVLSAGSKLTPGPSDQRQFFRSYHTFQFQGFAASSSVLGSAKHSSHTALLSQHKTCKTKPQLIKYHHPQWEFTLPHPPARSVPTQTLAQTGLRCFSLKCDLLAAAWVHREMFSSHLGTH